MARASEAARAHPVKRHPELPPLRHEELPPPLASWSLLKVGCAGGGTQGGGADRRPVAGGRLDEAALSLGAEPVAIAADGQHMAVVQSRSRIAVATTAVAAAASRSCCHSSRARWVMRRVTPTL